MRSESAMFRGASTATRGLVAVLIAILSMPSPPSVVMGQAAETTQHRRGPTGQWPPDFSPYRTRADIVTDGTMGGLTSALKNPACSDGCMIEHPGDIVGPIDLTRIGASGEVVVRPQIGKRADHHITGGPVRIRGERLLIAGYGVAPSGQMWVFQGTNSGYAWIEAVGEGGGFGVQANGKHVKAIFYELVYRQYGSRGDRARVHGDLGGKGEMFVVGSIVTGIEDPPPAHADTFQIYCQNEGLGYLRIRDSVVWPSFDKAIQGYGKSQEFTLENVYLASPRHASELWPGPGTIALTGYYHTAATGQYIGCTVFGNANGNWTSYVANSELYHYTNYIDQGGNTMLTVRPPPPPVPTHAQLDMIWAP